VQLQVSHFTSLPAIIAETDLIAIVPRSVGLGFAKLANIKLIEPPIKTPLNPIKQYWHRRFHRDLANMWLRDLVVRVLRD
jgi:DNA-binding transcriptional LysR family regulator